METRNKINGKQKSGKIAVILWRRWVEYRIPFFGNFSIYIIQITKKYFDKTASRCMQHIFTKLSRPFKTHRDQNTSHFIRNISGKAVSVQAEFWPAGNLCVPAALFCLQPVLLGSVPGHHALLHRGQGESVIRNCGVISIIFFLVTTLNNFWLYRIHKNFKMILKG